MLSVVQHAGTASISILAASRVQGSLSVFWVADERGNVSAARRC